MKQAKSKYRKLIEKNFRYKNAIKFRKEFDYSKAKESDWLLKHGQEKFYLMKEYVEYLDNKADSMLRYLGFGTGIFGFLVWFSCQNFNIWIQLLMGLGAFLWMISMLFSLSIKNSFGMPYPPTVSYVLNQMKKFDNIDEIKIKIALQYDETALAQKIIGLNKAIKLKKSYVFMVSALIVFLFSFLIVIFGVI